MLLHYSSLDYLKNLHQLVSQLVNGVVDPLLDLAKQQGRDSVLVNARWGTRDTAGNWSNNAWPILKELQQSLAKQIALRSFDRYDITYVNESLRGVDQFSMQWATDLEEEQYEAFAQLLSTYSQRIDATLDPRENSRWDDHDFAYDFASFVTECPRIPKFRVRTDIAFPTGTIPPRTGVYVSQTDPNAALQFAWTGSEGCRLRNARTFNEIGLAALKQVGRSDLWFNQDKMFKFATSPPYAALFHDELYFGSEVFEDLAPSAVARAGIINQPSSWYFVEVVEDDFEDSEIVWPDQSPASTGVARVAGGEVCTTSGYYFSPSRLASRRHFAAGEIMPKFDSHYGLTIWQWDTNQR